MDVTLMAEVQTTRTERTESRLELDGDTLKRLLGLPQHAEVTVTVPGGGDWSNTTLTIGPDATVDVVWTEETTSARAEPMVPDIRVPGVTTHSQAMAQRGRQHDE